MKTTPATRAIQILLVGIAASLLISTIANASIRQTVGPATVVLDGGSCPKEGSPGTSITTEILTNDETCLTMPLVTLEMTIAPGTLVGASKNFDIRLTNLVPVILDVRDSAGIALTLSPTGTPAASAFLPFYAPSASAVPITATYAPPAGISEPRSITVKALAPAGQPPVPGSITEITRGPFTVDTVLPTVSALFSDGAETTDPLLYHSESSTTEGIEITAADAGVGISKIFIKKGSAPTISDTPLKTEATPAASSTALLAINSLSEGAFDYHILAVDAVGNQATTSINVKIDHTGPVITWPAVTANENGWYKENPGAVTIADPESGVDSLEWTWSDGTSTTTGTALPVGAPTDGASTLEVTAENKAHPSLTTTEEKTFNIDPTPPAISARLDEGGQVDGDLDQWHNEPGSNLVITFSDATSGLWKVWTKSSPIDPLVDPSTALPLTAGVGQTTPYSVTIPLSTLSPGVNERFAYAMDAAGGAKAFDVTILVDRDSPTVSILTIEAEDGFAGWYTDITKIEITASDGTADETSGLHSIEWKWEGDYELPADEYLITDEESLPFLVPLPDDGDSTISFRARDNAHGPNYSPWVPEIVKLDRVAPDTRPVLSEDPVGGPEIGIGCSATDATSGIGSVDLYWEGPSGPELQGDMWSATDGCAQGKTMPFTTTGAGTYTFFTVGKDVAGNAETIADAVRYDVIVDLIPPTSEAVLDASQDPLTNDPTMSLLAYTSDSDIASIDYQARFGPPSDVPQISVDAFQLCSIDFGVSGTLTDDAFYLDFDTSSGADVGAVRLTSYGGNAPGTIVGSDDAVELGSTCASVTLPVAYYADVNSNARYDQGDYVYIGDDDESVGINPPAAGTYFLRLTPAGGKAAGTLVLSGDSDNTFFGGPGTGTWPVPLSATFGFEDQDDSGAFSEGDALWMNPQAVSTGDLVSLYSVRLAGPSVTFGSLVQIGDSDFTPTMRLDSTPSVCSIDFGTSGTLTDDAFYVDLNDSPALQNGAIRLVPYGGKAAGSLVQDSDTVEKSSTCTPVTAPVAFYGDVDDDGMYSEGDYVYLGDDDATAGINAPTTGTWFVRLTPAGGKAAGTLVTAGDSDLPTFMNAASAPWPASLSSAFGFLDADLSTFFGNADSLWFNPETISDRDTVNLFSIRLAGSFGTYGSQVVDGDAELPTEAASSSGWDTFATQTDDFNAAVEYTATLGDGLYYFRSIATDHAGNVEIDVPVAGDVSILLDSTAPIVESAETRDRDEDGLIDAYRVTFSEAVDTQSLDLEAWTIGEAAQPTLFAAELPGPYTINLYFDEAADLGTGEVPELTAQLGAISDAAGNALAAIAVNDLIEVDAARPVILTAETQGTASGKLGGIRFTLSEPINVTSWDADAFSLDDGDYEITGGTTGTAPVEILSIILEPAGTTASRPLIRVGASSGLKDVSPRMNALADYSGTATDKAAPVLLRAVTQGDGQGKIDGLELVFSEPITRGLANPVALSSVRLASGTFGSQVEAADDDLELPQTMDETISLCSIDFGEAGKGYYLDLNDAAGLQTYALRIAPYGGKAAGSLVTDADTVEKSGICSAVATPVAFYGDANANDEYDDGDFVYIGDDDATPGINAPDAGTWFIRLTPAADKAAGTLVQTGDLDLATFGTAAPKAWPIALSKSFGFHDADDNGFDAGDALWMNPEAVAEAGAETDFTLSECTCADVEAFDINPLDDRILLLFDAEGNTDDTPLVSYAGEIVAAVKDRSPAANALATFSDRTALDGAAPLLLSAETKDDGNGRIDAYALTFTEAIKDATFAASSWSVAGTSVLSLSTGATANDAELLVNFAETPALNTGSKPEVTYTRPATGGLSDLADNPLPSIGAATVVETDGAGPRILKVDGYAGGQDLTVTFSEAVRGATTGSVLNAASFVYTDGATGGASSITTVTHTAGASTATVRLNQALSASDYAQDRLAAKAGAIMSVADGDAVPADAFQIIDTRIREVKATSVGESVRGSQNVLIAWTAEAVGDVGGVKSWIRYNATGVTTPTNTPHKLDAGAKTFVLTGLAPNTKYQYTVQIQNATGGLSNASAPRSFTTHAAMLSGIKTNSVSPVSATLNYTVASGYPDARSYIEYGKTSALGNKTANQTGSGTKIVTVSGLESFKDYSWKVVVQHEDGSILYATPSVLAFKTLDVPPIPKIKNLAATEVTVSSAKLAWTIEGHQNVTSKLELAPLGGMYAAIGDVKAGAASFTFVATGLAANKSYTWRVVAEQPFGPGNTSAAQPLKTAVRPAPVISGVTVDQITQSTALVHWSLTGPSTVTSRVVYGITKAYGLSTPVKTGNGTHTAQLTGLAAGALYNLRIEASQPEGPGANSANSEFKTISPPDEPEPSDFPVPGLTVVTSDDGVVLTWNPPASLDVAGYLVYRSQSPWVLLATIEDASRATYTDNSFNTTGDAKYFVAYYTAPVKNVLVGKELVVSDDEVKRVPVADLEDIRSKQASANSASTFSLLYAAAAVTIFIIAISIAGFGMRRRTA